LSDIQAAVGLAQVQKLGSLLGERRRLALHYSELLAGMSELILPADDLGHTYQSYVVRLADGNGARRNAMMEYLAAQDIQTRPGTHAVVRLGHYARLDPQAALRFPRALCAEDTTITLPIFPDMSAEQQDFVVASLKTALAA